MKDEEIAALPVNKIADKNCALFLWTTFPLLDKQIRLFKQWGFTYKTLGFSWIKTNPKNGKPCFGVGYYAKSNCEVCLMGIKGRMTPISNKVSSCVISPRREHSRKPDEVRESIYTEYVSKQIHNVIERGGVDVQFIKESIYKVLVTGKNEYEIVFVNGAIISNKEETDSASKTCNKD